MKLIGFTGKMGVGKSTAINCIRDFQDNSVKLVKFAQPLYDIQEYIYNRISTVHERNSTFTKDRKLLQWLGTDWGRDGISQTLWVDLWEHEVKRLHQTQPSAVIVCDDLRFDNEAEIIKKLGGTIIKLESDASGNRIDITSGIVNHASESGINSKYVDGTIHNNGTIEDLKSALYRFNETHKAW